MLTQTPSVDLAPLNVAPPGMANRIAKRLILSTLGKLSHGHLELRDSGTTLHFGDRRMEPVTVTINDASFYRRLLTGGSVGAGEAFADGAWSTCDLTGLLRLFVANRSTLSALDNRWSAWLRQCMEKRLHRRRNNTLRGSRRNIAAHYDLSNEFFALWLDSTMMYSSAMYRGADLSLEEAAFTKLENVCHLLDLKPGDEILEIGSGWGGFAIHAAKHYGARVTTVTLSQAQFKEAKSRIKAAGLNHLVQVILQDYRKIQGQFDKVVSIEMVEAVGDEFVDGYFKQVEHLLRPGGRFVIQAITIQDQHYARALREVDFIKKHIFPGSFIPSIKRLVDAAASTPSLRLNHLEDLGLDYAQTLRHWSERFAEKGHDLARLGFDQRFQRLWQFYFSYCAAGFLERAISDVQMVFINSPQPLEHVK